MADDFDLSDQGKGTCCVTKIEFQKCYIVWALGDFSFCKQDNGEALPSCIFAAEEPGSVKFRAELYPRGTKTRPDDVVLCLRLVTDKDRVQTLVKFMSMIYRDNESYYKTLGEAIISSDCSAEVLVINREELFKKKEHLFPDDKIAFVCAVKSTSEETTGIFKSRI